MKELESQLKNELLKVYESYLNDDSNVVEQAKKVYNEYIPANTLISEKLMGYVARLFSIAYPDSGSGIVQPTKEEAKDIIVALNRI